MENRSDFDRDQNKNKWPLPVVIALGVITALAIGNLFLFAGAGQSVQVTPIGELLESVPEGSNDGSSIKMPDNIFAIASEENETETQEEAGAETEYTLIKGGLDVSEVVKAGMPSIVSITSETVQVVESYFYGRREIPSESAGSGIIIGEENGELLIATNEHVIDDADTITVCFSVNKEDVDEGIAEAQIKGMDARADLAVVAVSTDSLPEKIRDQIKVARLGDSDELLVGEPAIAIGNALGYGQSVTLGIISALDRELMIDGGKQLYIQTDAAINFGNSGGALLNHKGQVIGINSAKAASSGVEGMGYAIPINEAIPVLQQMMNRETRVKVDETKRGSLGIVGRDVSADAQQIYGIPAGAFVYGLYKDSAAANAGLEKGDIIVELDGYSITDKEMLDKVLAYYAAGEAVELVYARNGGNGYENHTVTVTLQSRLESEETDRSESPYQDFYSFFNNDPFFGGMW